MYRASTLVIAFLALFHGLTHGAATYPMTEAQAKNLASRPRDLVRTALNLMRQRRSVRLNDDDNVASNNVAKIESETNLSLETSPHTDEDAHVIDKREIPASLEQNSEHEYLVGNEDDGTDDMNGDAKRRPQLHRIRRNLNKDVR